MKLEKVITALKSYVRGNKNDQYLYAPLKGDVIIHNSRVRIIIEHGSRNTHIELPLDNAEGISKHFTFSEHTCGNEWKAKLDIAEAASELSSIVYPEGESVVIPGNKLDRIASLTKKVFYGERATDNLRNAFLIDSAESKLRFITSNGIGIALESFPSDVLPEKMYSICYLATSLLNAVIEKKANYNLVFGKDSVTFYNKETGFLFEYTHKGCYVNENAVNTFINYSIPSAKEIDSTAIDRILACIGEADEVKPENKVASCIFNFDNKIRTLLINKETRQNTYEIAAYEKAELQSNEAKKLTKLESLFNSEILKSYITYAKQVTSDNRYYIGFAISDPRQARIVLHSANAYFTLMPLHN